VVAPPKKKVKASTKKKSEGALDPTELAATLDNSSTYNPTSDIPPPKGARKKKGAGTVQPAASGSTTLPPLPGERATEGQLEEPIILKKRGTKSKNAATATRKQPPRSRS
jgi:hypothetical protein